MMTSRQLLGDGQQAGKRPQFAGHLYLSMQKVPHAGEDHG